MAAQAGGAGRPISPRTPQQHIPTQLQLSCSEAHSRWGRSWCHAPSLKAAVPAVMRPIANLSSHTTLRFGGPRTQALLPRKRGRRAPVQLCFKPVNRLLQDLHQVCAGAGMHPCSTGGLGPVGVLSSCASSLSTGCCRTCTRCVLGQACIQPRLRAWAGSVAVTRP